MALLAAVFSPAAQAAPQCVSVVFFDKSDQPIITLTPVIGMMIGGQPVITAPMPEHASRKPGGAATCPQALVQEVTAMYTRSCLGETMRAQAAAANNTTIAAIESGCTNMQKALQTP